MVFGRGRDQQKPDHKAVEAKVDEEMHGLVTQLTNEITSVCASVARPGRARARMGVSPGRISQILGGGENLTLRTLAALATALDARFDFEHQQPEDPDEYTPARHGRARARRATTTRSRGPSTSRAARRH